MTESKVVEWLVPPRRGMCVMHRELQCVRAGGGALSWIFFPFGGERVREKNNLMYRLLPPALFLFK